jgi:hypothetical protein
MRFLPATRGAFLSRQFDGVPYIGIGEDGGGEGFWIELGDAEQVRAFTLNWPYLERYQRHQIASPNQIIECIRRQRVMVLPGDEESGYFARVKRLGSAQKLMIRKAVPYYAEGTFGAWPMNDVPAEYVSPCVELEVTATVGGSNEALVVYSPILSSDVIRLLKD